MKDVDIREEIILMRLKREDAKRTKLIQSSSSDQIEIEKIISLDRITEALERITNTLQRIEGEVRHGQ
tara:strand:+ start:514 stop:717 length:204 start_codon:yes stop_codon:yes gene_type:complete